MMFFIYNVNTYAASGKTKKGALIQDAALRFKHNMARDAVSLSAMVKQLEVLVKVANENLKGAELFVSWHKDGDSGQISVHPKKTGYESPVVVISYHPVVDDFQYFNVRDRFQMAVQGKANDMLGAWLSEAYEPKHMNEAGEGGEL